MIFSRLFLFTAAVVPYISFYIFAIFELMKWLITSRLKLNRNFIKIISLFSIVILLQSLFYSDNYVFGIVEDTQYRFAELSNLGSYPISGTIHVKNTLKFIFYYISLYLFYLNLIKVGHQNFIKLLRSLIMTAVLLQILIALGSLFKDLNYLGAPNFQTLDPWGVRYSIGFYEPSLLSVVIIPILFLAVIVDRKFMFIYLLLLVVFFLLTRSGSYVVLCVAFVAVHVFQKLKLPNWALVFILLLGTWATYYVMTEFLSENVLFDSISDRLRFDGMVISSWIIFGVDFGQVSSFIPFYTLILQVGLIGSIVLLAMFNYRISYFFLANLIIAITGRLWFMETILALLVLKLIEKKVNA